MLSSTKQVLVRQLYVAALLRFLVKTVWFRTVGLSAVVLARGVQLPCPISHLVTDPPPSHLFTFGSVVLDRNQFPSSPCRRNQDIHTQPWKRARFFSDSDTPTLGMP